MRLRFSALLSLVVTTACRDAGARTAFSDPETVSAATTVGAAPMFALSPRGTRAVAWVSAPDGGTDGRLYVSTGGAPSELRDSLGPIEPHGEAPPKALAQKLADEAVCIGPAASAQRCTTRFWTGIALSAALALGEAWLGLVLAYCTDWPTSFWITALSTAVYLVAVLPRSVRWVHRAAAGATPSC